MTINSNDSPRARALATLIDAGLIAILLTAPTQRSIEISDQVYLSAVDPLVWLLCAAWGLQLLMTRSLRELRPPPLFLSLFIVVAAISVCRAGQMSVALKDLFQLVEYFLAALLLFRHAMLSPARLRRLLLTFVVVGAAITVFGLIHYLSDGVDDFEVRSAFGNRNVFGGFLALLLPLCFGMAMHESNRRVRVCYAAIVVVGLGVTLSGGSVLAVGFATAVAAMMRSRGAFAAWLALLVIAIVLVLPVLPRGNLDVLFESVALFAGGTDLSGRYVEWQAAVVMTLENPWCGVGLGNYQANIGQYYGTLPNPVNTVEADSQNMYLVIASTTGMPGLVLFFAFLLHAASRAASGYREAGDARLRGLNLGLFAAILAFSINCIWSPLLVRGIGIPLAFLIAMIEAVNAPRKEM